MNKQKVLDNLFGILIIVLVGFGLYVAYIFSPNYRNKIAIQELKDEQETLVSRVEQLESTLDVILPNGYTDYESISLKMKLNPDNISPHEFIYDKGVEYLNNWTKTKDKNLLSEIQFYINSLYTIEYPDNSVVITKDNCEEELKKAIYWIHLIYMLNN